MIRVQGGHEAPPTLSGPSRVASVSTRDAPDLSRGRIKRRHSGRTNAARALVVRARRGRTHAPTRERYRAQRLRTEIEESRAPEQRRHLRGRSARSVISIIFSPSFHPSVRRARASSRRAERVERGATSRPQSEMAGKVCQPSARRSVAARTSSSVALVRERSGVLHPSSAVAIGAAVDRRAARAARELRSAMRRRVRSRARASPKGRGGTDGDF